MKAKGRGTTRLVRKERSYPVGKAFERLRFFELQRGLAHTRCTDGRTPHVEAPRRRRRARARRGRAGRVAATSGALGAATLPPFLAALRRRARLAPPSSAPAWEFIGPDDIPRGQTYGSGGNNRPPVSGRIAGFAVDPLDRNHLLVASAGGGIWSSADRGVSWTPLTDFQPTLSMGAITFAPSQPRTVYAGTGEGDTFSQLGVGLLVSTDSGHTWSLRRAAELEETGIYDIAVDPTDHQHLLVGTWRQLLESRDGGRTWRGRRNARTWDFSVSPGSTGEVFAACRDGVFRSTNAGTTWSRVPLPGYPTSAPARIEVCHAPSDPSSVYVVAAFGTRTLIWRRSVMHGAFSRQAVPVNFKTAQAWYDWCATVDPDNPDVLYIGAIELVRGVRRSNSQWRWRNISSRSSGDSIHPDQHYLHFDPHDPRVLYVGNDGGLYRSPDGGTRWESLNHGLGITEFEFLAQHPSNLQWVIGGTQDNGTLNRGNGTTWNQVAFGDGGDCGVISSRPSVCYHSYYGLGMERSNTGGGWNSWQWIGPNSNADSLFYPPLEVRRQTVAQAGSEVYISITGDGRWCTIPLPQPVARDPRLASALWINGDDEVLVGTNDGRMYAIRRAGGDWGLPVALGTPRAGGYLSDIFSDANDRNRIWVTCTTLGGDHVFLSVDHGRTWQVRGGGLPDIPVNAIVADPSNPRTVYIGTDHGVYRSRDEGRSWRDYSRDLPNVVVGDLLFHERRRLLRAGTRNRGVWQLTL